MRERWGMGSTRTWWLGGPPSRWHPPSSLAFTRLRSQPTQVNNLQHAAWCVCCRASLCFVLDCTIRNTNPEHYYLTQEIDAKGGGEEECRRRTSAGGQRQLACLPAKPFVTNGGRPASFSITLSTYRRCVDSDDYGDARRVTDTTCSPRRSIDMWLSWRQSYIASPSSSAGFNWSGC
jgi:hypothetical protein